MKFRTELKKAEPHGIIDYSKKILCIGSCFAENIHKHLLDLKFNSFLNPCGITYNPSAIANSIYYTLGMVAPRKEDIFQNGDIFHHFDFHSSFSALSAEDTYAKILENLSIAAQFKDADILILSLGTSHVYEEITTSEIVNNCHKLPADHFKKRRLSVAEVQTTLMAAIGEIRRVNPSLEVIVTVSPVRHLKDGMVANNLSKSTLLLAISELEGIIYFPSYELLLDDLRDYRFYDVDLVHPSKDAVTYILEYFEEQFFDPTEKDFRKRIKAIRRKLNHRPFFAETDSHQKFLNHLIAEMESLSTESTVDFSRELALVHQKLKV